MDDRNTLIPSNSCFWDVRETGEILSHGIYLVR